MRRFFIYISLAFFVLEFCSSVRSQEWVKTFKYVNNGIKDGEDKAFAMTVDSDGNIIVTGIAHGLNSGTDICTIKYEPDGDTMWVKIYKGAEASEDKAYAITVDEFDNIYITGQTTGSNNYCNIITIKYSPTGEQTWARTFGSSEGDDIGQVIVADNANNVYVGGFTTSATTGQDYAILKYNAEGILLWDKAYSCSGNNPDVLTAIDVSNGIGDHENYLVVTGTSRNGQYAENEDVVTLLFKQNGDLLWTRVFNGGEVPVQDKAYAITVDEYDAIYITGTSKRTETSDIFVIKYDYEGNLKWDKFYEGNFDDVPSRILATSNNNVLVCGYTRTGFQIGSEDFLILNYHSNNGNLKWNKTLNGPDNSTDAAIDMVVSRNNQSVFVTGYCKATNPLRDDILTAQYKIANGELQDSAVFNTSGYDENTANSIAIDQDGNLYISGYSVNRSHPRATVVYINSSMLTMKYSSGLTKHHNKAKRPEAIFRLSQNSPNPFNPVTVISFNLSSASHVTLKIFDITGRQVFELINANLEAGEHTAYFNGSNLSSGVYFYELNANGAKDIKKMILLK